MADFYEAHAEVMWYWF